MSNPLSAFKALFPDPPLLVGDVVLVDGQLVRVALPDGALITARGDATVGQRVFVRDGLIEGAAPTLTVVTIEV